jgi:hypothetical protein
VNRKGEDKMKKSNIAIMAAMVLIAWTTDVFAAEILGYPIVAKQAKFYSIILGVIAASVALVSTSYLCFWLADLKKRAKVARPVAGRAFAGELVAAAQSAK